MSDEWRWIAPDGFEYSGGLERLCTALDAGELPPGTMVWRTGLDEWKPAWQVAELKEHIPAAPDLKTPAPIGISADAVVVASPSGRMHALSPPAPAIAEPIETRPQRPPRPLWLRALPVALGGLFVLGGIVAIGWYASSRAKQNAPLVSAPSASAAPAPSAAASETPRHRRCFTNRTKPLEKTVVGKIPIVVSASPDADALLVGLAASRQVARAVTIDTETLAVRESKEQRTSAPIAGIPPIDVDDARIRMARTIEADGKLEALWPGEADQESTVPRVDGSAEVGYLVTLRRGGRSGKLRAGWLGPDGARRSELASIEVDASELGTPTAAVGSSGGMLAVAARASSEAPWDVFVGAAEAGEVPSSLAPLAGGGERPRMSPAAAALPSGDWVLQWTERTKSGHEVRVQILDASLAPLTEPVTVSPEGSSSGQGEIWARADRIVSLFLVVTKSGHELWGSVVSCK